ncbi:MAG: S41 family peptidase [Prolixibacteraceae bacterium]
MEENILFYIAQEENLKLLYHPKVKIFHKEDASTNAIFDKTNEKRIFMYKNQNQSAKLLLKLMKYNDIYKNNMYEFVNMDSSDVYIQEIEPVKESPENVVILINERTASAAESLTYRARQSKKVKIMGTPSGGVLDYGSTRWTDFGSDDYKLSIPTFRSLRLPEYPIDNIGLQPDIYLDESVTDWIQYARNYLENR